MKVMSIFGTRPEMIKMWGTLKKLDEFNFDHVMVHTGQNFTPELKDFFFQDLQLRKPDYELGIDTSSYGKEVADVVRNRLPPQIQELMDYGHCAHIKEIIKTDVVKIAAELKIA